MAQKKFLYEVLVRGTKDGEIAGAHQIWAKAFTDDETGETEIKVGTATALDPDDVKALITKSFVGAAAQVARLGRELDEAKTKVGDAEAMVKQHAQRSDALAEALVSAQAAIASQAKEIEAANGARGAMALELAALARQLDALKAENGK